MDQCTVLFYNIIFITMYYFYNNACVVVGPELSFAAHLGSDFLLGQGRPASQLPAALFLRRRRVILYMHHHVLYHAFILHILKSIPCSRRGRRWRMNLTQSDGAAVLGSAKEWDSTTREEKISGRSFVLLRALVLCC